MAGRPRRVDDAVILRAAVEVIGRVGPARLTLAAVAEEAGVVPGTLVQRFGSKRGLLLALADQSVRETATSRRRNGHGSALAALRAFAVESMAEMATPERYANHLAFLCLDLTDPELHERALAVHRANGELVEALLSEAAATGELRPGTDAKALAGTVQAVLAGAGLNWALDREGALADRLARELDAVLSPHVP
ncbi:TetR/AcrR family transcriptional regulator [Actinomadura chibensis]|uniref:TetR/AcrR family transcriptional regulator n=1 Tax=Actinomadura chibensis TaxID=392828 RepID=A0A5D0NJY9_9ACTN|nr:TetR/AcrR family transcriptional regulator [Actinomadura chibensis]TYB44757.1 TetR/AcrR family transcriptional regulator [Actinomadura chibensis]